MHAMRILSDIHMHPSRNLMLLAALSGVFGASTGTAFAQQFWKFQEGNVSIRFETPTMKLAGLTVSNVSELDTAAALAVGGFAWKLNPAGTSIGIVTHKSQFDRYETGEFQVAGGFSLNYKGKSVDFRGFRLIPTKEAGSATFRVLANVGTEFAQPIELNAANPIIQFNPRTQQLEIVGFTLTISEALADFIGAPELKNYTLGGLSLSGKLRLASGPPSDPFVESEPENPGRAVTLDVGICRLSSMSMYGRESIGGVMNSGFAVLTTSINHGTGAIAWRSNGVAIGAVMPTEHPVIGVNLFRINAGKLEQIGEGWLKHGWAATNSTECPTSCTSSGSGTALGAGCTDTYGAGLNAEYRYLGPKSEINPYTGIWTAEGGWFAQGGNDRLRRITNSQVMPGTATSTTGNVSSYTWAPTQSRMKVTDPDLQVAGSQFLYEGFYAAGWVHTSNSASSTRVQQVDVNKYNNYAYRFVTPNAVTNTSGAVTSWTMSDAAALNGGPAINAWGDSRVTGQPRLVGDVITAVKVTDIGGGWYFYDYAVYNLDLDREVDAFTISVADSVDVRNITFRDTDKNATNQWTMERSNGNVRWTMPAGGNALSWARLFNFRFEAQTPPVPGFGQADMRKVGTFPYLTYAITGPTPALRPINGTATIPGRGDGAATSINLRLTPVDGGSVVNVNGVAVTMTAGTFSGSTINRGRYNVSVGGAPFLRKNFAPVVTLGPDGNDIPVNVTLIAGDVDGSNEIDAADIDAAIAAFGAVGNNVADVDGSGEVDAADIDMIIGNFGQTGDL